MQLCSHGHMKSGHERERERERNRLLDTQLSAGQKTYSVPKV